MTCFSELPTAWPMRALKRDNDVTLGKMLQSSQSKDEETEEFYLRSANIQWGGVDVSDIKTMWLSVAEKRDLLLQPGDLLVNEGGDIGRCSIWGGELENCYFQNSINRVRPRREISSKFLYYWLHTLKHSGYLDARVARITIAHLTAEKLKVVPIPSVKPDEQKRIAAYLDASCRAIDAAVAAKREQIATLHLTLESVVVSAVTSGLDRSVRMKPSQIDWLPEVPQHWNVQHIKRRCELLRGKFSHRPRNDPAFYDGPYPFIQTGDISSAGKYITSYSQTLNEEGLAVSKQFPRGTLVMSIAANIGDVAILDFEACFPDSVVGLVPNHQTDLNFLFYMMRAMRPLMMRSAILTTQFNLNYVRIGMNYAAFPPRYEQIEIGAFLDAKSAEVAATIDVLKRQMDTLTAYRKSLIHECVTGQRRITEADLARVQAHA